MRPDDDVSRLIAQTYDGALGTHLHRLFAKTETSRQAELVKLVAGFANPLVN